MAEDFVKSSANDMSNVSSSSKAPATTDEIMQTIKDALKGIGCESEVINDNGVIKIGASETTTNIPRKPIYRPAENRKLAEQRKSSRMADLERKKMLNDSDVKCTINSENRKHKCRYGGRWGDGSGKCCSRGRNYTSRYNTSGNSATIRVIPTERPYEYSIVFEGDEIPQYIEDGIVRTIKRMEHIDDMFRRWLF